MRRTIRKGGIVGALRSLQNEANYQQGDTDETDSKKRTHSGAPPGITIRSQWVNDTKRQIPSQDRFSMERLAGSPQADVKLLTRLRRFFPTGGDRSAECRAKPVPASADPGT